MLFIMQVGLFSKNTTELRLRFFSQHLVRNFWWEKCELRDVKFRASLVGFRSSLSELISYLLVS